MGDDATVLSADNRYSLRSTPRSRVISYMGSFFQKVIQLAKAQRFGALFWRKKALPDGSRY